MIEFNEMTDEELALSYAAGNNEAFDELLKRNQSKLFSYILFVVHDRDIANDVFQETFVKVITQLREGKYSDCGKFAAWIMRIAHNVIMDVYRCPRGLNIVDQPEGNDLSRVAGDGLSDYNIEERYVNAQALSDVRRMMDLLPATQREVVYMRFYQDMSFKEIAEATGVSINTSLGRMRYAVINMRRMARKNNLSLEYVER